MNTWAILHIINAGFLSILMIIHFRFTKKDHHANRLLSLMLFTLAYESFIMFLFSTRSILVVPHFGRTGTFSLYLIYPLAFLYIRNLLGQEKLKWADIIHLLPIVLYIIDFSAYFLQSAEIKRQQMQLDYATGNLYIAESPRLFPRYFHFRFRTLLSICYIFLSFRVWMNIFYKSKQKEILSENKSLMQWTLTLCILLLIGIVPASIVDLFGFPIDLATIQNISLYLTTISFALFLFFRPDIVYGIRGLWVDQTVSTESIPKNKKEKSEETADSNGSRKIYLKEDTVEKLVLALHEHFLKDKAYLINSYSITDLSVAVGYPTHQVSAYLNAHLGINFNEYINTQRVEYLLKQIKEKPEWKAYTLETLGQKVGFNNRYTFLNAFKKITGETPSAYLKNSKIA